MLRFVYLAEERWREKSFALATYLGDWQLMLDAREGFKAVIEAGGL
jgi:hypothetical protein